MGMGGGGKGGEEGWDFNEAGGGDFRGQNALRKLLGPKVHLDWLIIDSNGAKIIIV